MSGYIPTLEQVDELHHRIAPSQAAYDLIHTHCVIVAQIACRLARHQNELYLREHPQEREHYVQDYAIVQEHSLSQNCEDSQGQGREHLRNHEQREPEHSQNSADPNGESTTVDGEPNTASGFTDCNFTITVTGGKAPDRLLDEHLVEIGGLLHDIGTYYVLKNKHDGRDGSTLAFSKKTYIRHGLLGYRYLLSAGVDESVALFARNHTGVGLTRKNVAEQELPLPLDDYVPTNPEQETVMVADKFHSKSVPPKFVSVDAYTKRAERFGEDNRRHWLDLVDKYGKPDIPALAEHWQMRMI